MIWTVFSALLLPQSALSAQNRVIFDAEITAVQPEQLLAATIEPMVEPPSEDLASAIEIGKINEISVIHFTTNPTDGEVDHPTFEWTTKHVGTVHYEPVEVSDTREYHPRVTCSSEGDDVWFQDCHEESYVKLQTEWMDKPIDLEGDLTLANQDVKLLYSAVDDAALVFKHDGEVFTFTSDKIGGMLKHRHAGDRVNVYVTTADNKYGRTVYFKKVWDDDGHSRFAISEVYCDTE